MERIPKLKYLHTLTLILQFNFWCLCLVKIHYCLVNKINGCQYTVLYWYKRNDRCNQLIGASLFSPAQSPITNESRLWSSYRKFNLKHSNEEAEVELTISIHKFRLWCHWLSNVTWNSNANQSRRNFRANCSPKEWRYKKKPRAVSYFETN